MMSGSKQFAERFDVSRETLNMLIVYEQLLIKWNKKINLVSRATLNDVWQRHFADSAQLRFHARCNISSWADIGSGAGFPGAVLALLSYGTGDSIQYTLVESDKRKAAFLNAVSRETGVPFRVIAEREEDIPPLNCDVLSARALTALPQLLTIYERHRKSDGIAIFPKGANARKEIEAAQKEWCFQYEVCSSVSATDAIILIIGDIERVRPN